jgi:hypothetical protein
LIPAIANHNVKIFSHKASSHYCPLCRQRTFFLTIVPDANGTKFRGPNFISVAQLALMGDISATVTKYGFKRHVIAKCIGNRLTIADGEMY